MNERNTQLRIVSNRLVFSLAVLLAIGVPVTVLAHYDKIPYFPTPLAVMFVGFVGGFVGLQRRLKALPAEDLTLLANSWVCIALSPIAGAVLAELMYTLFISGLLTGSMFPNFATVDSTSTAHQFDRIFDVYCPLPSDYAKIVFWSFVAGFSEKFATNIIGQFEASGSGKEDPEEPKEAEPTAETMPAPHPDA